MKRAVCVPLVMLLSVAACRQPAEVDSAVADAPVGPSAASSRGGPSSAARPRIVFLGDSLTAGYGLDRDQSVPALIQQRLDEHGYGYEVVNAGVSGDTSAGGLSRFEWSVEGPTRVLVLELGANDGLRGLPVAEIERNLRAIIDKAHSRKLTVLLTGMEAPPNFGDAYTRAFRQVYRDLAVEYRLPFVPFYLEGVAGDPALNIADGIHPNARGAVIVADTLWRVLEPLLRTPPA